VLFPLFLLSDNIKVFSPIKTNCSYSVQNDKRRTATLSKLSWTTTRNTKPTFNQHHYNSEMYGISKPTSSQSE